MTESPKLKRDYVYLIFFTVHLFSILLVDLVPLYPPHLWKPDDAPLRALRYIRDYYTDTFRDPYFLAGPQAQPSWFLLFTYLEVAFQLPMNLWMFNVFENPRRGTTPLFELLCVPYGVEVALTTLTCVFDVAYWDNALYSVQDKSVFVFGLYGPWVVIPLILSVDMGFRLLARIDAAEKIPAADGGKDKAKAQ